MADLPENDQNTDATSSQNEQSTSQNDQGPVRSKTDYDKTIVQGAYDTLKGSGATSDRNLGTVGGGAVPSPGAGSVGSGTIPNTRVPGVGSGTPPGGRSTSNSTVSAGGTTGGGTPASGETTDRGRVPLRDFTQNSGNTIDRNVRGIGGENPEAMPINENPTSDQDLTANSGNTINHNAQGSIGGRNPSQPQTAMGDQDADILAGHNASTSPTNPMTSRDPDKINADQENKG